MRKEDWVDAEVPGSAYSNLLKHGLMPDPFYRKNGLDALRLMENDFRFQTKFQISQQQIDGDYLLLRFDGIDTLTKVYLNGRLLAKIDNMHRIWEFNIMEEAVCGENTLLLEFASLTQYIEEENAKVFTGGSNESMRGFPHLRKAHCMFGWDCGPRLPDAGIFREVSVLSGKKARLRKVYIRQN